jgi:adenylosuccinate lyase
MNIVKEPYTKEHLTDRLLSISPLDGRYHRVLTDMQPIFSEYGYIQQRVKVEILWFIHLMQSGLKGTQTIGVETITILRKMYLDFSLTDAHEIKAIEATTNHDVKAVEYWIQSKFQKHPILKTLTHWIHFACTSEDINNVSHALQLRSGRDLLLKKQKQVIMCLRNMAHRYAGLPMLSRTHGQAATPTTLGKELANVVARLEYTYQNIAKIGIKAKMNGAVGNYNAHIASFPEFDWQHFTKQLIEAHEPEGFQLESQDYTTQIEPHDYKAALFDAIARSNTVLIDCARDIWAYISLGYFKQIVKDSEVGSSTMPHKVNPIDFENAEGNLGLANALFYHLSHKLPISKWQRDLSDSTVLRNLGVAFSHSYLAYQSLIKGLGKVVPDIPSIQKDLEDAWEVLAEPIQTVMRTYGIKNAYELLKEYTRGKAINSATIQSFIKNLPISDADKKHLSALTPISYTGLAEKMAKIV